MLHRSGLFSTTLAGLLGAEFFYYAKAKECAMVVTSYLIININLKTTNANTPALILRPAKEKAGFQITERVPSEHKPM